MIIEILFGYCVFCWIVMTHIIIIKFSTFENLFDDRLPDWIVYTVFVGFALCAPVILPITMWKYQVIQWKSWRSKRRLLASIKRVDAIMDDLGGDENDPAHLRHKMLSEKAKESIKSS